jgi:hypothetical protein
VERSAILKARLSLKCSFRLLSPEPSAATNQTDKSNNKKMNFDKYYNEQFQTDIQKFFMTIPDDSKFHEDRRNKQIFSIQYERLTNEHNHLIFLTTNQDKINFGVALFFTILIDEIFYTYYKHDYATFQQLTHYPKFIGNCLSGCRVHLHPSVIFLAMNEGENILSNNYLTFDDTFFEAIPIMKRETEDFIREYIPTINGPDFWNRCISAFTPFFTSSMKELNFVLRGKLEKRQQ